MKTFKLITMLIALAFTTQIASAETYTYQGWVNAAGNTCAKYNKKGNDEWAKAVQYPNKKKLTKKAKEHGFDTFVDLYIGAANLAHKKPGFMKKGTDRLYVYHGEDEPFSVMQLAQVTDNMLLFDAQAYKWPHFLMGLKIDKKDWKYVPKEGTPICIYGFFFKYVKTIDTKDDRGFEISVPVFEAVG